MSAMTLWVKNWRTIMHELETPMRGHDADGECCLRAALTPRDDEPKPDAP